jgi:hypothetical protein
MTTFDFHRFLLRLLRRLHGCLHLPSVDQERSLRKLNTRIPLLWGLGVIWSWDCVCVHTNTYIYVYTCIYKYALAVVFVFSYNWGRPYKWLAKLKKIITFTYVHTYKAFEKKGIITRYSFEQKIVADCTCGRWLFSREKIGDFANRKIFKSGTLQKFDHLWNITWFDPMNLGWNCEMWI